jgi:hypothetical protein
VAGGAARRGWAEVAVEAFAAPCGFDDEDWVVEGIADDVTELEFGAKWWDPP